MYFLTLFLLVLTMFKLVSMQPGPFDEYKKSDEQYLKMMVRLHKITIPGKARLLLNDFISWLSKQQSNVSQGELNFKI